MLILTQRTGDIAEHSEVSSPVLIVCSPAPPRPASALPMVNVPRPMFADWKLTTNGKFMQSFRYLAL